MKRFTVALATLLVALVVLTSTANAARPDGSCDKDNKCPQSDPCCSSSGYCGSSSAHCLHGCDPLSSFLPGSCAPMPRCAPTTIDLTNRKNPIVSADKFTGNPNQAPLIWEGSAPRPSTAGLKLAVGPKGNAWFAGGVVSLSRYMVYGRVTARMSAKHRKGIVHSFILMSDVKDEIDWEFTTANPRNAETNMFWKGKAFSGAKGGDANSLSIKTDPNFDTAQFHDYTMDWSPSQIQWFIDGQLVRTIQRKKFKNAAGVFEWPSTPSRVQVGIWDASVDHGNAIGTQEWAEGPSDYSQADSFGTYTNTIAKITVQCRDPPIANASGDSYAYTKKISALYGQPEFTFVKRVK